LLVSCWSHSLTQSATSPRKKSNGGRKSTGKEKANGEVAVPKEDSEVRVPGAEELAVLSAAELVVTIADWIIEWCFGWTIQRTFEY
jgi:hypothetical protein